jgi:hypothetical protein
VAASTPAIAAAKSPARVAAVSNPQTYVRPLLIAAAVVGVIALGVLAMQRFPMPQFMASAPRAGNLTIETRPAGSEVLVDGERRGATPLKLALAPRRAHGRHPQRERRARRAADDDRPARTSRSTSR